MSRKIKDIPISPLLENATDNNVGTKLSTNCISRQAAIDALRKMQTYKMFSGDDMLLIDQAGTMTELMLLPPAEPQRIRGRWIYSSYDDESGFDESWECDKCGYTTNIEETNYCPNCGADMRGEQDG